MYAVIALIVGVAVGLLVHPTVPEWLAPYLPIAVVAALDAVFGGLRAAWTASSTRRCSSSRSSRTCWSPRSSCSSATSSASARSCPPRWWSSSGIRIFGNAAAIRRHIFKA